MSNEEFANTDVRDIIELYEKTIDYERKLRYQKILDIADATRMGFASVQSKKNARIYERWFSRLVNKINPKPKEKKKTIWDFLSRKSKKL